MKTWPSALRLLSVFVFAGLAAACTAASGPTPQPVPRVGVMHVGTDHNPPSLATLVAGLGDLGWFDGSPTQVMQQLIGDGTLVDGRMKQVQGEYDGQRIQLIWRNLDGKDQAEAQAQEFVRERVDLIVAFEDKSIAAAQDATADPGEPDPGRLPAPVGSGPRRPGRQPLAPGREPDRGVRCARPGRQAARDLPGDPGPAPQPLRLLTLVDPTDDPATPPLLVEARDAAGKLGIELDEHEASDDAGLEAAFQSLTPGAVDGVFILSPSLRLNFSEEDPRRSRRRRTCPSRPTARNGSTPRRTTRARSSRSASTSRPSEPPAARFVDSILKGAKPADLPAQEVPKVEFALSLKRAAELGITVPDDVVSQADLVYPIARRTLEPMVATPAPAASTPRLEVRGGRRDAGRGGHRLGRDQRVLVLLRGQQAGRDRGRGGQGVVRRHLDPPVHPAARRRPRRRGDIDPGRCRRTGIASGHSGTCSCVSAAISALTYLDATGTACVHAYSNEVDKIDSLDL